MFYSPPRLNSSPLQGGKALLGVSLQGSSSRRKLGLGTLKNTKFFPLAFLGVPTWCFYNSYRESIPKCCVILLFFITCRTRFFCCVILLFFITCMTRFFYNTTWCFYNILQGVNTEVLCNFVVILLSRTPAEKTLCFWGSSVV